MDGKSLTTKHDSRIELGQEPYEDTQHEYIPTIHSSSSDHIHSHLGRLPYLLVLAIAYGGTPRRLRYTSPSNLN